MSVWYVTVQSVVTVDADADAELGPFTLLRAPLQALLTTALNLPLLIAVSG